jgi:hypothetical protein
MSPLPTQCLEQDCQSQDIEYSVGVVCNVRGEGFEYPVVRCCQCDAKFFHGPSGTWESLASVNSLIPFTNDPQEIDTNNKLALIFRNDFYVVTLIPET